MKPRHHFWSSLALGGALYWATGTSAALAGAMLGGFAIDTDHIIDQLWSIRHGAPFRRESPSAHKRDWLETYFRPRKLMRLTLVFHSYELLALLAVVTLNLRTPFLIGLLSGCVLHLSLDLVRHHREFRSLLFYFLSFRFAHRFRREQLIKPEYQ